MQDDPQPVSQPEPAPVQDEPKPEPEPEAEPQPESAPVQGEPQQQPSEPAAAEPSQATYSAAEPPRSQQPQQPQQPEADRPHPESGYPQPATPQPASPQAATPQPGYPQPGYPQAAYPQSQPYPSAPGGFPGGPVPGPGYAGYPPPPARVKGAPLIRLTDLISAAVDAVVPLAAGLVAVVLGLLLVVGVGLSGVNVQSAGAADYFGAASWLTAGSLGTPFGGGFVESIGGLGSGNFSITLAVTVRAAVWLVTVLILFLAFRAARRRERRSHSVRFAQLVARSVLPALLTSIALLILALTTQNANVFGTGDLLSGGSDTSSSAPSGLDIAITQNGNYGIDTPLVFVGPLLLVLAVTLIARISVWIQAPESGGDPLAGRLRAQWDLWRPALRVTWLQTRIIVTLASLAAWFYVAVEAGSDSNSSDHPLVYVLGALVLILNLGIYGMFAGFGVTLYATAAGLSGGGLGGGLGGAGGLGGGSGSGSGSGGLSGSGFAPTQVPPSAARTPAI